VKIFLAVIGLFLLIGCSTKPDWVQDGKTRQDAKYDTVQCYDGLLKQHSNFVGLTDQEIAQLMSACMKEKGYHDSRQAQ